MNKIRLKDVCILNGRVVSETTDADFSFNYIDIGSVKNGSYESKPVIFSESPSRARKIVRKGDVIVSTVRTYLQSIASINDCQEPQVASTGFAVLTPFKVNSSFLKYSCLASAFIDQIMMESKGISYPAVNDSVIGNSKITNMSPRQQIIVSDFLEKKIQEADLCIQRLTQKLHLLEEYKTSLIHNAVTKGLDANNCRILDGTPAEEMKWKDSGVEWIGEIPEEWDVDNCKNHIKFVSGNAVNASNLNKEGNGFQYLRTSDVYEKITIHKDKVFVDNLEKTSIIKSEDDYVVCFDGYNDKLGVGTLGLVTKLGQGVISGELNLIQEKTLNIKKFLEFFMHSSYIGNMIIGNSRGSTVYHSGHIKNQLKCTLPDEQERNKIVDFLQGKLVPVQNLKDAINKKIAILLEYKKSLINEAVTGQLDL